MNNNWLKSNIKLIIIFLVLISISSFLINFRTTDKQNNIISKEKEKIMLVTDYSRFFTVDSCVNKFISFVSQKNSDSVYKLLNVDYIKNNSITKENIFNNIDNFNGNFNFSSRKMYYEQLNNNDYKYYIYGYLSEEQIDTMSQNIEKYYIVNLYTKNMLFDITPYDGKIFEEVK